jgi:hypothetical protein
MRIYVVADVHGFRGSHFRSGELRRGRQGSALPLAAATASLIEKVTS